MEALRLRRAPRMRKIAMSAVASSTAVGVFETRIGEVGERDVQAGMSIWS